MTKKKSDQEDLADIDDPVVEGDEDSPKRSKMPSKLAKLLQQFKNRSDFKAILYRIGERGKQEYLDEWEGTIPSHKDIKGQFGGGHYIIHLHDADGDQLDTVTARIAGLPGPAPVAEKASPSIEADLDRLSKIQTVFGGRSDNSSMMLEIMKLQSEQTRELTKAIADINVKIHEMNDATRREFYQLVEKLSEKKSGLLGDLSELENAIDFLERFRGGSDTSLFEKVLTSPVTQQVLSSLTDGNGTKPAGTDAVRAVIEELKAKNPEFVKVITREKREAAVQALITQGKVSADISRGVVDGILAERGL